jgi:hypothetical protein
MNHRRIIKFIVIATVFAVVVISFQTVGIAQCSMCRASLAGSANAAFIKQFNLGVLVLLVPPVAMFCSFFVILRRASVADDAMKSEKESDR